MKNNTILEKIKKYPYLRRLGIWVRRNIIKSKLFYFISNNPAPLSNYSGFDRGTPLDRFYIENFLDENKSYIKDTCLEILNRDYTQRFGKDKVTTSHVLDINKDNQNADIIADLRNMPGIKDNTYDCIILTQVLQFIDDPKSVIKECFRILKKGGTLLATLPSISRIDLVVGVENDFWRFTVAGAKILLKSSSFSEHSIESKGNCKAGIFFLGGMALEETSRKILESDDVNFPVIITIKAVK